MSKYNSKLAVVGVMNEGIVIYDEPEHRKPQAGEVVECGGRLWRILNPDGCGQDDVTEAFIQVWKKQEDFRCDDLEEQAELQATYDAFLAGTGRR